jgi:molybdate transport system substrate-binding protein
MPLLRRFAPMGLLCLLAIHPARAQTVFAAASLTDVLRTLGQQWQAAGHPAPRFSFAASATLARQIEQGAPAALFFSADARWMDALAARGLLAPGSRRDLLHNQLVLVVPADHPIQVRLAPGFDLAGLLGAGGRLAIGDPAFVPAGLYAREALGSLGLWPQVAQRLAPAADVRGALLLVARGEAPAGIVYATDAAVEPGVVRAGVFPPGSHAPITYPVALLRDADTPQARALLGFLESAQASAVFTRFGFGVEE